MLPGGSTAMRAENQVPFSGSYSSARSFASTWVISGGGATSGCDPSFMITVSLMLRTATVIAPNRSIRRQPCSGTRSSNRLPSRWIRSSWVSPSEAGGPDGGVVVMGTPDVGPLHALLIGAVRMVQKGYEGIGRGDDNDDATTARSFAQRAS